MRRICSVLIGLVAVTALCAATIGNAPALPDENRPSTASTGDVTVGLVPTPAHWTPREGVMVDTVTIDSRYIPSPAKFVYALPEDYFNDTEREYPVTYLLNGYSGSHVDWSRAMDLAKLATEYQMILICPDGRNSWYYDSPVNPKMQMESYITEELYPFVEDNFRTILEPEQHAITGLSMGGHGAFWLGGRHPELFGNIGSMSGGLNIASHPRNGWEVDRTLGPYAKNPKRWEEYSAISLVDQMEPGTFNIIFDCGESDFFIKDNQAMDTALTRAGIKHTFTTRPGKHTWAYWKESLPQHLEFFRNHFKSAYQP